MKKRAIVFKDSVLILETWDKPSESGNWIWFTSFKIDSIHVTDKYYDKCVNKQRIDKLRKTRLKEGKILCDECRFYGECDHQGPYQKDGKWCYE